MTDNDRIREELGFNLGSGEYNLADRRFTVTHHVPEKVVTILDNDEGEAETPS